MEHIMVDFTKEKGKIKPMHAVNNGPVNTRGITNENLFEAAGIPYARTHDSSFYCYYGVGHIIDIPCIFPDFNVDPADPASYDFTLTDKYLEDINRAGTKIFYRLGVKIEIDIKKYEIYPPKDFVKWAVICEHIIKHYNEGWANGFNMGIEYWEIWNEPDLLNYCWMGTDEQFFEMFEITALHLKSTFPNLKIGGPGLMSVLNEYFEKFMRHISTRKVPMDFFSWHRYDVWPKGCVECSLIVDEILKKYGYDKTESIMDEWQYVSAGGWQDGEEMKRCYKTMRNLKGSAYNSSVMCACQKAPVDMLMYYDARPCEFNGMFTDNTLEPFKGYYSFYLFNYLYKLGCEVHSESGYDGIYVCAAKNGKDGAIMFSYYDDDNNAEPIKVKLDIKGFNSENEIKVQYYTLDEKHDAELTKEETYTGEEYAPVIEMELYTTMLLKLCTG